jgi:hypothetical protein
MPSVSVPTAVAIGSLAVGAVGAGVSAMGAIQSGQAQSKAAAYQAQVAANNATTANQNAEYATQAGQAAAQAQSLKARELMGATATGFAASGVDPNSGSAADVAVTNRETGQLSTLNTVNNANLQAYGYRTQATSDTAQSALDTATAQQATTAGNISAAGDMLSGAASVGSKYVQFQNAGALPGGTKSTDTTSGSF